MKAIVLTYDRSRPVAEHMIACYQKEWPGNPFRFRIPYQKLEGENNGQAEFIQSPPGIKQTVLKLLEDLEDEEWIYWSIDDKYPVQLNVDALEKIYNLIKNGKMNAMDAILFCHKKYFIKNKTHHNQKVKDENDFIYLMRKNYANIWLHQFLKVKVIRQAFERFPDQIPYAKLMDQLILQISPPEDQNLYVTLENLALFGESTSGGSLTANCYESMKKLGISSKGLLVNEKQHYYLGSPVRGIYSISYILHKIKRFYFENIKNKGGKKN